MKWSDRYAGAARCLAWLMSAAIGGAAVRAQEPAGAGDARTDDLSGVWKLLYEKQNDPAFEGQVRFLRGVPLISKTPDCLAESQYYTSLIIHGRQTCQAMYYPRLNQLISEVVAGDEQAKQLRRSLRYQASLRIWERVFGHPQWAEGDHGADLDHPHPHPHPHDQATDATELAELFSMFGRPSRIEATTGLHALEHVDAHLKADGDRRAKLIGALGTHGIEWRIYDHEAAPLEQCKRFVDKSIPFAAHRAEGDLLICGYAEYQGKTYLMGYDLAAIERKVTLNTSGASMPYSEYLRFKKELAEKNPQIELDPLFWDYSSYFSIQNLPSFRFIAATDHETVTAVYPAGLDMSEARSIVTSELQAAVAEQTRLIEKEIAEKQAKTRNDATKEDQ